MDVITDNYGVLVIDNRTQSNSLTDIIYHYKADPDIGEFRVAKEAWELSLSGELARLAREEPPQTTEVKGKAQLDINLT